MLRIAVKASIPIVTLQHADVIHVGKVLEYLLNTKVGNYTCSGDVDPAKATLAKSKLASFDIFYVTDPEFRTTDVLFNWLNENEKTLILVNHAETPHTFNAGSLQVPEGLIVNSLKSVIDTSTINQVIPLLQGLTLKSISELVRITSAKDGSISAKGIAAYRSLVSSSVQGLALVDKVIPIYYPDESLSDYVTLNTPYFKSINTPMPLIPRGLLLDGQAGTGKTSGAKYIANAFSVPLYRMDLSASLNKYVGSSERNFAAILAAIEQEPACVFLIDEAEKLFGGSGEDDGVTKRLLAQLLWFLQEHKNRIFTVITTNDIVKLPPELYRPGRIDQVITLGSLGLLKAMDLAYAVAEQFVKLDKAKKEIISTVIQGCQKDNTSLTPSRVTSDVYALIKKQGWLSIN